MLRPGGARARDRGPGHAVAVRARVRAGRSDQRRLGDRCNPHPHVFSDRMLRPGRCRAFFDVIHSSWATGRGYSDFQRRCVTRSQIDAYKQCREWLDSAIELVRPAPPRTRSRVSGPPRRSSAPRRAGVLRLQCGHGLGVGLYEAPMISRVHSLEHRSRSKRAWCFPRDVLRRKRRRVRSPHREEIVVRRRVSLITRFPAEDLPRLRQDVRARSDLLEQRSTRRSEQRGSRWDVYRTAL